MSPDLAETLRQAISAVSLGQCQAEIAQNWLHLTPNQLAQLKLQLFRNGSNADRNLIQMVDAAVATGQGCWAASMSIDQTAAPKGWESPSRGYWTLGGRHSLASCANPSGAVGELRAQFTNDSMKTLLRAHIERDVRRLDQHVQAFTRQLADFTQIEVLNRPGQFTFFRRLLNYDDWRIAGRPKSTQFLDYQVVNSNIEAERDHLRVGDHIVRVLTMKEAITETRPLVLNALLKIPANFCAVTEWLLRFLRLAHIRPTVLGFLGADRVLRHPYFPRYVSRTRRHRFDGAASPMTTVTSPFAKLLLEVRSPLSRRTATRPPRAS